MSDAVRVRVRRVKYLPALLAFAAVLEMTNRPVTSSQMRSVLTILYRGGQVNNGNMVLDNLFWLPRSRAKCQAPPRTDSVATGHSHALTGRCNQGYVQRRKAGREPNTGLFRIPKRLFSVSEDFDVLLIEAGMPARAITRIRRNEASYVSATHLRVLPSLGGRESLHTGPVGRFLVFDGA